MSIFLPTDGNISQFYLAATFNSTPTSPTTLETLNQSLNKNSSSSGGYEYISYSVFRVSVNQNK